MKWNSLSNRVEGNMRGDWVDEAYQDSDVAAQIHLGTHYR